MNISMAASKVWSCTKKGFILPFTLILALLVLTTIGLWYRQVLLQSFLAKRLIEQRSLYLECRSLLPIMVRKLNEIETEELQRAQTDFFQVTSQKQLRWQVDRSAWVENKIRFTFRLVGEDIETLNMTVSYKRN